MRAPLALAILMLSCGGDRDDARPEPAPPEPVPVEAVEVVEEACAQVIVVAWQGAQAAPSSITRSEDDARLRIEDLRRRLDAGEDFALLARTDSDAPASGPRGGLLGTYARAEWPAVHAPIRDVVFGLEVHQTSDVVHAPYGFVIARRCPVEKVHTRHVLVRYAGARNAGEAITRSANEARARAESVRARALAGADFADLAREASEDGSAERGGDVGDLGRGRLAAAYEEAAFALAPGAISEVVETEYGFHVIQRLPEAR